MVQHNIPKKVILASGGYPWTVSVNKRNDYMEALEKASVDTDIENTRKS